LKKFLNNLKPYLIDFLKGQAVKLALKKLLGSAVAGGFKAWLIKYIVTELYEELGEPLLRFGLNKLGYYIDKQDGRKNNKKNRTS
jgi:hypothetical protein